MDKEEMRIKKLKAGNVLLFVFLAGCVIAALFTILGLMGKIPPVPDRHSWGKWILIILSEVLILASIFWIRIYFLYRYSVHLGIRWRIWGIAVGMIPIAHLVMLFIILSITTKECRVEQEKIELDRQRVPYMICKTKYPLLLVHGVFFRDFRFLNYWGRIPGELEKNGATVFYCNQQSAESVASCGKELADRIAEICKTYGCEKVNVIAHSKGGLDMRAALNIGDTASHVASLTTINTPHRGCEFADYLLGKIGPKQQEAVAKTYNTALRKLGDSNPDFLAAVYDLTAGSCAKFNETVHDVPGVFYQSVGSKMNVARGGRFPLNLSTYLVNHFDGPNDGLVGERSFAWGEKYQFLTVRGSRGISHGDMIDLNRENIDEFDVREFYVQLVYNLKNRGF